MKQRLADYVADFLAARGVTSDVNGFYTFSNLDQIGRAHV